jgi:hypothetical protein
MNTQPLTVSNAGTPIGRTVFISEKETYSVDLDREWTAAEIMLDSIWKNNAEPVATIDPRGILCLDFRK